MYPIMADQVCHRLKIMYHQHTKSIAYAAQPGTFNFIEKGVCGVVLLSYLKYAHLLSLKVKCKGFSLFFAIFFYMSDLCNY